MTLTLTDLLHQFIPHRLPLTRILLLFLSLGLCHLLQCQIQQLLSALDFFFNASDFTCGLSKSLLYFLDHLPTYDTLQGTKALLYLSLKLGKLEVNTSSVVYVICIRGHRRHYKQEASMISILSLNIAPFPLTAKAYFLLVNQY